MLLNIGERWNGLVTLMLDNTQAGITRRAELVIT